MSAPYSRDLRERIVEAMKRKDTTYASVAEQFSVGRATVNRIWSLYRKTGQVFPPVLRCKAARALGPADLETLRKLIVDQPDATVEALRDDVVTILGRAVSHATVGRELRRMGFTLKTSVFARERQIERIKGLRARFLEWMKDADPERLVFIDEAGSTISMAPLCGRSPRGERPIDHVARNRGTVTTVLGALRIDKMNALMTIEGGTSTDVFEAYVEEVLGPTLRPGDIVVMDNLAAHRHERVRDAIHRFGAFVKYLPPYSPNLNPIELAWSTVKDWLRQSRARTHAALDEAISAAASNVRQSQAAPCVRPCGYQTRSA